MGRGGEEWGGVGRNEGGAGRSGEELGVGRSRKIGGAQGRAGSSGEAGGAERQEE